MRVFGAPQAACLNLGQAWCEHRARSSSGQGSPSPRRARAPAAPTDRGRGERLGARWGPETLPCHLCLQGEVVPHDPGGERRQPALQREHHLRATGVRALAPPALGPRGAWTWGRRGLRLGFSRAGRPVLLLPGCRDEGPPEEAGVASLTSMYSHAARKHSFPGKF